MIKHFKHSIYLIVLTGFSWANSGSFEDFFIAIKRDDVKSLSALLNRGFDVNTRDEKGFHGLYLALKEPSPKVTALLLGWPKIEVEARTAHDESALMIASLQGDLETVRRLIAMDADVNKPGWTALHYAATNGHLAIMELLLAQHAYIDSESPNGTTPLMMAAQYGTGAAVKLLLDAGADAQIKNQLGLTAMDFAQRASRKDAMALLELASGTTR